MLSACKKKGKIATLPEVPGVLVFKTGHVGVYIGGGYVIHAGGHNKGVVKEKLMVAANWTDWGYCPLINYVTETNTEPKSTTPAPKPAAETKTTTSDLSKVLAEALKNMFTHKVKSALNVRASYSASAKRIYYKDFPDYIKEQMTKKTDYLPAGVKIHCYKNVKGWYKIDDKRDIWVAGNYTTKL